MEIIQIPIPLSNFNPIETQKKGIVFHWIVGELVTADATFKNPNNKVSAHYGIGSTGTIHQYIDDKYIAWHAGNSDANRKYIGIEHAGGQLINGERKKPTDKCHAASIELCTYLCKKHGFELRQQETAWRHGKIVATTCPGSLDVEFIVREVQNNLFLNNNRMQKLEEAKEWNNMISFLGLTKNKMELKGSGSDSCLINKLDNGDMEDLLIQLKELTDFIQARPNLKNNPRTDLILERYAYYVRASQAV